MTIIEPRPMGRAGEDQQDTRTWSMPEQGTAPPAEFRTDLETAPREVGTPHLEALPSSPPASRVAFGTSQTSSPQPTAKPAGKVRRLVLTADSVVLAAFFAGGLVLERWVLAASAMAIFVLVVGRGMTLSRNRSISAMLPIVKTWALIIGPASAVVALSGSASAGRELIFGGLTILAGLLSLRAALRISRVQRLLGVSTRRRCLLVGDKQSLMSMVASRGEWPGCDELAGILLQETPTSPTPRHEAETFVERIVRAAQTHHADQVTVVPGGALGTQDLHSLSWALEETGIDLAVTTELKGVAPHRVEVTQVGDRLLIQVGSTTPRGVTALIKGAFDRASAATLLLLLSPLLLALLVAVRIDSPGPGTFRQTRVRKGGEEFTMYKFRTMHDNAEAVMQALWEQNDHGEAGILFKMREDPRVTRFGRLLRRTSLDELPQLLNVLKGEMSLIGPRPALPREVALYDDPARRRLAVKPGMTGLWQVNGRSNLSWEESLRFDLDYVDNWSPGRETVIALKTVKAMLNQDGAY